MLKQGRSSAGPSCRDKRTPRHETIHVSTHFLCEKANTDYTERIIPEDGFPSDVT
jgi:hypothetical protein